MPEAVASPINSRAAPAVVRSGGAQTIRDEAERRHVNIMAQEANNNVERPTPPVRHVMLDSRESRQKSI